MSLVNLLSVYFAFLSCGSVMDFDCRLAVGSVTWTGDVEESRPLATDQKMKMMMMTIIATAEASRPAQSPAIVMGYLSLRLPFFSLPLFQEKCRLAGALFMGFHSRLCRWRKNRWKGGRWNRRLTATYNYYFKQRAAMRQQLIFNRLSLTQT